VQHEEKAMRWGDMRESQNVEDRTGAGPAGGFPLGGGFKLGGGALILIVLASFIFGINPLELLGLLGGGAPPTQQTAPPPGYGPQKTSPPTTEKTFSAKVLGDTEDVWDAVFKAMGSRYEPPKLVLYDRAVRSACGVTPSAAGPFYCPADRTLNLDTSFFDELHRKFGAPGDFAQAYVIAHEVGHHVQNQFGTMRQFEAQSQRVDDRTRNALSIRLELQADCYAGVWGFFAQKRGLLEPGDLESGLRAAAAVGDDQIQKRSQGYVVQESFTHGSAQQRMHWFKKGFDSGDPRSCNTFEQRTP
jgi:predicted metalloprotease